MKRLIIFPFLLVYITASLCVNAQSVTEEHEAIDSLYNRTVNSISFTKINGYDIYNDNLFKQLLRDKKIQGKDDNSAYFLSQDGLEYVKIFSGPDIGFGKFYSIGYTKSRESLKNAVNAGKLPGVARFVIDKQIKLGDLEKDVWNLA